MEKDEKKDEKKNNKPSPDIDTSRFIIKQKLKSDTTRFYTPIANISERERRQFNQGNSEPNINAILVEKARNAIKIAESHIKEETQKLEKNVTEKAFKSIITSIDLANKIKDGDFEYGFDALTGSSEDLEDKV